jgi:Protein kinase domain
MAMDAGTRLGPYEILAPLGKGGMGEVYKAHDARLDRVVAIKVLPSHLAADPEARSRFDREARAIAGLNHPNICALFDVGRDVGHDFLVMELLEGETLQDRLGRGPFGIGQLVDCGLALVDALDAAHTRGLIHRDLKPANIFLTTRGVPKILDFGLAKTLETPDAVTRPNEAMLTGQGTMLGTIAYMSPEQLRGETLDARTDLFSLGLVLYEMATGQRAFGGETSAVVSAGILGHDAPPPRRLRPDLPPHLEDTILKAIEKDRSLRCQSAVELRADLMRIKREGRDSAQTAASAVVTPTEAPAAPGATRNKGRLIAAAAVLLFGVALGGGYWWSQRPSPSTAESTASVAPSPGPPAPQPAVPQPTTAAVPTSDRSAAPPGASMPAPPTTEANPRAAGRGGLGRAGAAQGTGQGRNARAGRGLAGPSVNALVTTLRTLPPQAFHVVFLAGNSEARDRAFELQRFLIAGGWMSSGVAPIEEAPVPLGIGVPRRTQAAGVVVNWAVRNGFVPEFRVLPNLKEIHIIVGAPQ